MIDENEIPRDNSLIVYEKDILFVKEALLKTQTELYERLLNQSFMSKTIVVRGIPIEFKTITETLESFRNKYYDAYLIASAMLNSIEVKLIKQVNVQALEGRFHMTIYFQDHPFYQTRKKVKSTVKRLEDSLGLKSVSTIFSGDLNTIGRKKHLVKNISVIIMINGHELKLKCKDKWSV